MNRRVPPQQDTQHTPPSHQKEVTFSNPRALVQRAVGQGIQGLRPTDILQLQKTMGNAAVAQLAQSSGHVATPHSSTSTVPIQRIKTKAAQQIVQDKFGEKKIEAVWKILMSWLNHHKLNLSELKYSHIATLTWLLAENLDLAFLQWMQVLKATEKDFEQKEEFYYKFLAEVSTAKSESHPQLKWLVSQDFLEISWVEETEVDEKEADDKEYEYVPDIDEVEDEDEEGMEDEVFEDDLKEEGSISNPNANDLLKIEETGQRTNLLEQSKANAIKNVKTSDVDTFEPKTLEVYLKENPHLLHEKENLQLLKKITKTSNKRKKDEKDEKAEPKVVTEEKVFRPKEAGDTHIVLETFTDPYTKKQASRTVLIEAEVVPTKTTGRQGAPEPDSGIRVSTTFDRKKKFNRTGASATEKYSNQGFADGQKGHIIALELGGPDVPKNIVPQWAQWQMNGLWRTMEKHVLDTAANIIKDSEQKRSLQMRVNVYYKAKSGTKGTSFTTLAFPTHFMVEVWEIDSKTKEAVSGVRYQKTLQAEQDHTDDKMMFRHDDQIMFKEDGESPYDLSEIYDKNGRPVKKARKKSASKKTDDTSDTPKPPVKKAPAKKKTSVKKTPPKKNAPKKGTKSKNPPQGN